MLVDVSREKKEAIERSEYTYLRLASIDRFTVIIFDEIYHQSGAPFIEMINEKIWFGESDFAVWRTSRAYNACVNRQKIFHFSSTGFGGSDWTRGCVYSSTPIIQAKTYVALWLDIEIQFNSKFRHKWVEEFSFIYFYSPELVKLSNFQFQRRWFFRIQLSYRICCEIRAIYSFSFLNIFQKSQHIRLVFTVHTTHCWSPDQRKQKIKNLKITFYVTAIDWHMFSVRNTQWTRPRWYLIRFNCQFVFCRSCDFLLFFVVSHAKEFLVTAEQIGEFRRKKQS